MGDRLRSPLGLIIRLEGNRKTTGLPHSLQFVQWTLAATPLHPVLKIALNKIVKVTLTHLLQTPESVDVISWTGPSLWTDAVL